ncbi:MAG: hypothetical protein Kapaf2KO_17960 [Candidatus Kapaibacteriales bacterium]
MRFFALILLVFVVIASANSDTSALKKAGYFGGENNDQPIALALDSNDRRVFGGTSLSLLYPTTQDAFQRSISPGQQIKQDAIFTISDSTGSLIYSTYFGGEEEDFLVDIEIAPDNTIWLLGHTRSKDFFPKTDNAIDTTYNGGYDIFLANFSGVSGELLYSTYIGGQGDDFASAMSIMPNNSIAITGYSVSNSADSTFYPVTVGARQSLPNSEVDGFLTIIRNNNIEYSSFIGGSGEDYSQEIVFDSQSQKLFLLINSSSLDLPLIGSPAVEASNLSSTQDNIYICSFDYTTNTFSESTYLGGSGEDIGYGLSFSNGNLYISGSTSSRDFPISTDAFDKDFNGSESTATGNIDGFLTEINSLLSNITYSSYIGGESMDRIYDISLSKSGRICFLGQSSSFDYPVTGNAINKNLQSKFPDIIFGRLTNGRDRLSYSTFIGGKNSDIGYEMLSLQGEEFLLMSSTESNGLPTTPSYLNPLIQKVDTLDFYICELLPPPFSTEYFICEGDSARLFVESKLPGSLIYDWFPKTDIIDDKTDSPTVFPDSNRVYTVLIGNGSQQETIQFTVEVSSSIKPEIAGLRLVYPDSTHTYSISNIDSIVDGFGAKSIEWKVQGGDFVGNNDLAEISVKWSDLSDAFLRVDVELDNGCLVKSDSYSIGLNPQPLLRILPFGDHTICEGDTVVLDGGSQYYDFLWNRGNRTRYDTVWAQGNYNFTAKRISDNISVSSGNARILIIQRSAKPRIRKQGVFLRCLFAADFYQWYEEGRAIPGANEEIYEPPNCGIFSVGVRIGEGCESVSDEINTCGSVEFIPEKNIYPNPANDKLFIRSYRNPTEIKVLSIDGTSLPVDYTFSNNDISVDVSKLATGSYILLIYDSNSQVSTAQFTIIR